MKYQGIIFVGPPYSGKGSQCELLNGAHHHHFSSGEAFRTLNVSTDLGMRVHKLLNQHEFVGDKDTISLIKESLNNQVSKGIFNPTNQYLLQDGFPRNVNQISLLNFIETRQVFNLIGLTNEMAYFRAQHRVEDAVREGKTPRIEDQSYDAIDKRINDYNTRTLPILQVYQDNGIDIIEINCTAPKKKVHKKIRNLILTLK
jgi:adenylate kinase